MSRDWRLQRALYICDYNEDKALMLLELLDSNKSTCKFPSDLKMKLPDEREQCTWFHEDKCMIDMPDSVHKCNGTCSNFKTKDKQND